MRTHIDWLTFTMTMRYNARGEDGRSLAQVYADTMETTWHAVFPPEILEQCFGGMWEKAERSRAPYTDAWTLADAGVTLFASPSLIHCCVEISGQGCERIIELKLLESVLAQIADRVTRIDIAVDIETETKPDKFAERRAHKRMQADGYQNSKTGSTVYIGSQKSDRYARVYRYNPPHPRAHLLRVEHVFRKAYAKRVAREILDSGLESVSLASGRAFGWAHADWKPEAVDCADISLVHEDRETGKTVFWLLNSVAPAFKRLCADGTIQSPEEFLKRYFLEAT